MKKFKEFAYSPLGLVAVALTAAIVIFAYASKIPGLGMLQKLGAKLPGSDAKNAAAPIAA